MTAEATETRVTAYFTLEGGFVHLFALDIGIFLLRHPSCYHVCGNMTTRPVLNSLARRATKFINTELFARYPGEQTDVNTPTDVRHCWPLHEASAFKHPCFY